MTISFQVIVKTRLDDLLIHHVVPVVGPQPVAGGLRGGPDHPWLG
jgi:hypothetical protein